MTWTMAVEYCKQVMQCFCLLINEITTNYLTLFFSDMQYAFFESIGPFYRNCCVIYLSVVKQYLLQVKQIMEYPMDLEGN